MKTSFNKHFFLFLLFIFPLLCNAQLPECDGNCTANDIKDVSFFIGDSFGDPLPDNYSCTPPDPQSVYLYVRFEVNANNRYAINVSGNLYINGVFASIINECLGDYGSSTGLNVVQVQQLNWICGDKLTVDQTLFSWQQNNSGSCETCPSTPSKCKKEGLQNVESPLFANFTYECSTTATGNTIDFTDGTTGRDLSLLTYSWDFGDGSVASIDQNPTHEFNGDGPFTVVLTVSDGTITSTKIITGIMASECCRTIISGSLLSTTTLVTTLTGDPVVNSGSYVSLLKEDAPNPYMLLETVPVEGTTGMFEFSEVENGRYKVILHNTPAPVGIPSSELPMGYMNFIVEGVTGSIVDVTVDGVIDLDTDCITGIKSVTNRVALPASGSLAIVVSEGNLLPITLVNFFARQEKEQVKLKWNTANEVNFSHFELLKSSDSKEFVNVAKINSNSIHEYSYSDNAFSGTIYYMLKMVDLDGTFEYSKIISLENSKNLSVVNPVKGGESLIYTSLENPKFSLYSLSGEKQNIGISKINSETYKMILKSSNTGSFVLKATSEKSILSTRLIIE